MIEFCYMYSPPQPTHTKDTKERKKGLFSLSGGALMHTRKKKGEVVARGGEGERRRKNHLGRGSFAF